MINFKMTEVSEDTETKIKGRLEDLASDSRFLKEYLGIRVDVFEDSEVGTIVGHGADLEEIKERIEKDKNSGNSSHEYHIFWPQEAGESARKTTMEFMPNHPFKKR